MGSIVRLAALEITNIKNVRNGRIVMPNANQKQLSYKKAEVLGLYGQNGSGKTAVIDALDILQRVMIGLPLKVKSPVILVWTAVSQRLELISIFSLRKPYMRYIMMFCCKKMKKVSKLPGKL